MERMAWTDERMDDFAGRVSADIRELRQDSREHRTEMRAEFRAVRDEIAELRLIILRFGGGILIAQFGMIAAVVARGISA